MSNHADDDIRRALDLRRSQSLTNLVQKEIERMILSGELKAGERVNENLLAGRFSISRGPVREACRGLEQAGLVTVIPNRGVFVREVELREALQAYDIRACLFGLAAKTLASVMSDEHALVLSDLVRKMETVQGQNDVAGYYPLNLQFHARIVEFSANEKLASVYQSLVKELHMFRRRGLMNLAASTSEHRGILESLLARDSERARHLAEAHVLAGRDRLLVTLDEAAAQTVDPERPWRGPG